jgi:RimJ/RimL family protein N-acetyltransferase
MIVTDDRVALFVAERCHVAIVPPFTCMGLERNGEVVAGVVFNCFTWADIQVTVAGHGFTRAFIRAVGRYVFEQLGCLRMSIVTEQPDVMDYAKRLGAQTEGRIRNHFGQGRDGIALGILREEWTFR